MVPDGQDEAPELEVKGVVTEFDPSGSGYIKKIALAEMSAETKDGQQTTRLGRVFLMPSGQELVVGKALNARSAVASRHVPRMTICRFPRIVFQPAPPDKAAAFAGGGEATALAHIAELKRYGRISMAPRYEQPEDVVQALTMDDVRQAGNPTFNRFRGFHGDHAYAAFHPSDVRSHGVYVPDMNIPGDLVLAGAWGFLAAGAAMALPTTAVFFNAGGAVPLELYATGAAAIKKHCIKLAVYLSSAAKYHAKTNVGVNTNHFLQTGQENFGPVVKAVREARTSTFSALTALVKATDLNNKEVADFQAAATMLKLAASFYPGVLNDYNAMLNEYLLWRESKGEGARKPQKFIAEAAGDAPKAVRRAATLTICGYIFMPGSDGIGVNDVFQLSGEGVRYGEFDVLPLGESLKHGVLSVGNNLATGLLGFRVRGHAAHTLKAAHRIIMLDAVQAHFGEAASWAAPEAARVWMQQPKDLFVVQKCSARELVLRSNTSLETRSLQLAVHRCASSKDCTGTVVPLVFCPANELVFERSTRCPRGAVGAEREQHGAQLLRAGDEVTVWTTPSAEEPGKDCLVAARCWNLECSLLPEVAGLAGLAFDIVDNGTEDLPTPLEVVNATIAHGVVHRQPATVAPYVYSPTKQGVQNMPGQGVGKSEWLRFITACAGPNLVDTVNDHERLVASDAFNDKGFSSIFQICDDVANHKFLLSGATKAAITGLGNEARVKHGANKTGDNFNTLYCTSNEFISLDAVEEADNKEQRRVLPVRAWSTHVGRVDYFAYVYGTYRNVNPLIYKCILEFWRTLPDVRVRGTGELQEMAKRSKAHWSGQVPMHVGFLQALYNAPRMESGKVKEARTMTTLTGKTTTLLTAIDVAWEYAAEKDVLAAARQYVQENYDTHARNPGRIRENAQLIVNALKSGAESGDEVAWAKLYQMALPGGVKEARKQLCFSVQQDVLKMVVETCGFRVYDTSDDSVAPDWP